MAELSTLLLLADLLHGLRGYPADLLVGLIRHRPSALLWLAKLEGLDPPPPR